MAKRNVIKPKCVMWEEEGERREETKKKQKHRKGTWKECSMASVMFTINVKKSYQPTVIHSWLYRWRD